MRQKLVIKLSDGSKYIDAPPQMTIEEINGMFEVEYFESAHLNYPNCLVVWMIVKR